MKEVVEQLSFSTLLNGTSEEIEKIIKTVYALEKVAKTLGISVKELDLIINRTNGTVEDKSGEVLSIHEQINSNNQCLQNLNKDLYTLASAMVQIVS